MSTVAEFIRWEAGTWNYPNQSLTGSEYMFGGIADYGQEYPCPNGLGISERKLSESPAWRRRIEKARRDAAEHREHIETIDRLARMLEVGSDTESTEVIEATERDDFAPLRTQFERLTERFLQLMKRQGTQ